MTGALRAPGSERRKEGALPTVVVPRAVGDFAAPQVTINEIAELQAVLSSDVQTLFHYLKLNRTRTFGVAELTKANLARLEQWTDAGEWLF